MQRPVDHNKGKMVCRITRRKLKELEDARVAAILAVVFSSLLALAFLVFMAFPDKFGMFIESQFAGWETKHKIIASSLAILCGFIPWIAFDLTRKTGRLLKTFHHQVDAGSSHEEEKPIEESVA